MKRAIVVAAILAALAGGATDGTAASARFCPGQWNPIGPISPRLKHRATEYYDILQLRARAMSCPFQRKVETAALRYVVRRAGGAGVGDFYTRAYSPVTKRWYRLHVYANGDLNEGIATGIHPWMNFKIIVLHTPNHSQLTLKVS